MSESVPLSKVQKLYRYRKGSARGAPSAKVTKICVSFFCVDVEGAKDAGVHAAGVFF